MRIYTPVEKVPSDDDQPFLHCIPAHSPIPASILIHSPSHLIHSVSQKKEEKSTSIASPSNLSLPLFSLPIHTLVRAPLRTKPSIFQHYTSPSVHPSTRYILSRTLAVYICSAKNSPRLRTGAARAWLRREIAREMTVRVRAALLRARFLYIYSISSFDRAWERLVWRTHTHTRIGQRRRGSYIFCASARRYMMYSIQLECVSRAFAPDLYRARCARARRGFISVRCAVYFFFVGWKMYVRRWWNQ